MISNKYSHSDCLDLPRLQTPVTVEYVYMFLEFADVSAKVQPLAVCVPDFLWASLNGTGMPNAYLFRVQKSRVPVSGISESAKC
jgi:hypothetical protein